MNRNEQPLNLGNARVLSEGTAPWLQRFPPSWQAWEVWREQLLTRIEKGKLSNRGCFLGVGEDGQIEAAQKALLSGGRFEFFEIGAAYRRLLLPIHEAKTKFCEGELGSQEFFDLVTPRIDILLEGVVPTFSGIEGLSAAVSSRLESWSERGEMLSSHLFSGDWGRAIGGLIHFLQDSAAAFAFPGAWWVDDSKDWGLLESYLEPVINSGLYAGAEVIISAEPVTASVDDDSALMVGWRFSFFRPEAELLEAWRGFIAVFHELENGNLVLKKALASLELRTIGLLIALDDKDTKPVEGCLDELAISILGEGKGSAHWNGRDPNQLTITERLDELHDLVVARLLKVRD